MVKDSQTTLEDWYDQYKIEFKNEVNNINKKLLFRISTEKNKLVIRMFDEEGSFINSYNFNSLSTTNKIHDLPFDLIIYSDKSISF